MRINSLLLSIFVSASFSLFAVAEDAGWTFDWSAGTVGKPATSEISPHVRFSSRPDDHNRFKIVGTEGSPVHPFSNLEKALLIERGGDDKPPVVTFSLPGKAGYGKGAFEFDFFLVPGENTKGEGLRFSVRTVNQGAKPTSTGSFRLSPGRVTFQATGESESPIIKSRTKMKVGEANTVKVEWDFDAKSGFTVSLNGEPLTLAGEGTEPVFFPISAAEAGGGVRDLIVYPRADVSLFIGKVTASAK